MPVSRHGWLERFEHAQQQQRQQAGPRAIDEILSGVAQVQGLVDVDKERSVVRADGGQRFIGRCIVWQVAGSPVM
jgi:hypothetical protein